MKTTYVVQAPPTPGREWDRELARRLLLALEWRTNREIEGADERGPGTGERWSAILARYLADQYGNAVARARDVADLAHLVDILRAAGTRPIGSDELNADVLARVIENKYQGRGRKSNESRDTMIARHYAALRERYPTLARPDAETDVATRWSALGSQITRERVHRIVGDRHRMEAARAWLDHYLTERPNDSRAEVLDDVLAIFDPRQHDQRLLESLMTGAPK